MAVITIFSFCYNLLVVPNSLTKWSIINVTGATARFDENDNVPHHATYGYRQKIIIVFPEDEVKTVSDMFQDPMLMKVVPQLVARTRLPDTSFWYWFFGGTNEEHCPKFDFSNSIEKIIAKFKGSPPETVTASSGVLQ